MLKKVLFGGLVAMVLGLLVLNAWYPWAGSLVILWLLMSTGSIFGSQKENEASLVEVQAGNLEFTKAALDQIDKLRAQVATLEASAANMAAMKAADKAPVPSKEQKGKGVRSAKEVLKEVLNNN